MRKTTWEIYFDKSTNKLTNDNFSWFIRSKKAPTKREARSILTKAGKYIEKGYHILFIIKSTWGKLPKEDVVVA